MMKMKITTLAALMFSVAAASLAGCGTKPLGGGSQEDTGTVGLALQLAPGVVIDSAMYTITGPNSFSRTGAVDVSQSSSLTVTIGGLPAGTGYSIAITANATTGGITCMGSAAFAVMARATTNVVVAMQCREPGRNGMVHVGTTFNVCPVADELSALPAETRVGSALDLTASAHDTDNNPLTFAWTAPSGTFSNASSRTPQFTCTLVGPVTVTVTVSDGSCSDSLSTTVSCLPAAVFTVAATVETIRFRTAATRPTIRRSG